MSAEHLVQRPRARQDVREIIEFLTNHSPEAAAKFYAAYKQTLVLLSTYPEGGKRCPLTHPALANLRMLPIQGFPKYLVFTDYDGLTLEVVRVLHSARNIHAVLGRVCKAR